MHFVYVIQSRKTKDLYFGCTSNLEQRLVAHNEGRNSSTKFGIPWEIVFCEGYRSSKDAKARESKLKYYGNARTHIKNRIKNSLL